MSVRLVDPTFSGSTEVIARAERPSSLRGLTIGLVDNGKTHGRLVLEQIARNLDDRHGQIETVYLRKKVVSLPPEPEEVESLAERCGAILTALGD